jgi:hypothetical protein
MKYGSRYLRALTLSACMLGTALASPQNKSCSDKKAIEAEKATDSLRTWDSVYRFYKQYSQCDDGSVGEGISDAVAKLLAHHWDSFSDFVKLAANDKAFEKFVVRHVDETIDWTHDAPEIHENAGLHCPSNAARLCKILITQTTPESH